MKTEFCCVCKKFDLVKVFNNDFYCKDCLPNEDILQTQQNKVTTKKIKIDSPNKKKKELKAKIIKIKIKVPDICSKCGIKNNEIVTRNYKKICKNCLAKSTEIHKNRKLLLSENQLKEKYGKNGNACIDVIFNYIKNSNKAVSGQELNKKFKKFSPKTIQCNLSKLKNRNLIYSRSINKGGNRLTAIYSTDKEKVNEMYPKETIFEIYQILKECPKNELPLIEIQDILEITSGAMYYLINNPILSKVVSSKLVNNRRILFIK